MRKAFYVIALISLIFIAGCGGMGGIGGKKIQFYDGQPLVKGKTAVIVEAAKIGKYGPANIGKINGKEVSPLITQTDNTSN